MTGIRRRLSIDRRGLYQGIWGSSCGLAFLLGPALGGLIYERLGSGMLWGPVFLLGVGISIAYLGLARVAQRRAPAAASP